MFGYGKKPFVSLDCETNQPATFVWKQCYKSEIPYDQCDSLYKNNLCFNISDENKNFEVKSFDSVSTLIFTPTEPRRGCFGCLAYNEDNSVISFTAYMFRGVYIQFNSMKYKKSKSLNIQARQAGRQTKETSGAK